MAKRCTTTCIVIMVIAVVLVLWLLLRRKENYAEADPSLDAYSCHQVCDIQHPGDFQACQIAEQVDNSAGNVNPGKHGGPLRSTGMKAHDNYPPCVRFHGCVYACRNKQRQYDAEAPKVETPETAAKYGENTSGTWQGEYDSLE
jgi:hypothetical protein